MRKWALVGALALLVLPKAGVGATYYIDFASGSDSNARTSKASPWKRAPGMNGFAGSYTHSPGDQFIFKGGVTWDSTIAKWTISNSGASGNPDYYGVDKTWFTGGSYSPPIFDGGSNNPAVSSPYIYITGSYVTLDGLQVQNIGVAGTNQGNYAIEFLNDHDITAENMTLPVQSRIALYYAASDGATHSNLTFSGNDISNCSWGIAVGEAAAGTIATNVLIHDNRIHDLHSQIANGAHGDGIIVYTGNLANSYESGQIYNNVFYGDFSPGDASKTGMNALIFLDNEPNGTFYVYNNVGGYASVGTWSANGGGLAAFIEAVGYGSSPAAKVYAFNNSMLGDQNTTCDFTAILYPTAVLENNIFAGARSAIYAGDSATVAGLVSDYNDFYNWSLNQFANLAGGAGSINYSQYRKLGYEAHGLNTNPLFVSSADLHLQPSSPVIQKGVNLSSIFTTDAAGHLRPSTGLWDLGAYEVVAKPQPPANLRIPSVH